MSEKFEEQEFVEYVVKRIVDKPEAVEVERTVDERGVLLTLKVDPSDMGYVIGRHGNTAKAIRTILRTLGMKTNARINLKIFEPEGSGFRRESSNDDGVSDKEENETNDHVDDTDAVDLKI